VRKEVEIYICAGSISRNCTFDVSLVNGNHNNFVQQDASSNHICNGKHVPVRIFYVGSAVLIVDLESRVKTYLTNI
jgi:hypothetical protein